MEMEELRKLYRTFLLIRQVELRIAKEYHLWEIRCPTHLSIGQELISAMFSIFQRQTDFAVSTHRSHAHYLAKGGHLGKMIAELYGKRDGCSRGRGGSMHLVDPSVNFMGSSSIVGNSIPVGVGLGLHALNTASNQFTFIFLGDAAVEEGVFYESLNFAALKNLPVVFICENNGLSTFSNFNFRQPESRKIFEMVNSIGVRSMFADGNNINDLYAAFHTATKGNLKRQPFFLELSTVRWLEHCGPNNDDALNYRDLDFLNQAREQDPLKYLSSLVGTQYAHEALVQIEVEIDEAFEFARAASFPTFDDAIGRSSV